MMEQGYLLFRAEGEEVGSFLTLASDEGITIQKFCQAEGVCFGYLSPSDYRAAARLGRSVGIRLRILEKNGVSFALSRFRRRLGLVVWPVVFTGLLLFSQCFLWAVDVTGCETLDPAMIQEKAAGLGLRNGLFLPGADLESITIQMRKELPGVATLSLNRVGSRVEIAVTESTLAPMIEPTDPCNLVAAKTGQVVSVSATEGQAVVKPGQTVAEGELLVSGITETPDGKSGYVHAAGEIIADTVFEKSFTLRLNQTEQVFSPDTETRYWLDLFGQKVPLFLPDAVKKLMGQQQEGQSESKWSLRPLTVLGIPLPVGIYTETRQFFTMEEKTFSEEEALLELEEAAADYEAQMEGTLLSRTPRASVADGVMTLTVDYSYREDIALTRPIEVELVE